MRLLWTELDRFRNLKKQKVYLHPRFNLLVGRNGQGKTNFLEAVGYLGTLKSFRSANRFEMIEHGADMCRVAGRFENGQTDWIASFSLAHGGRTQFLDDKKISSPDKYLNWSGIVSFIPEDVALVSGSPSSRRKAVDRAIFQNTDGYAVEYRKFLRVLRNRNALLRNPNASHEEWKSWTRSLSGAASLIVRNRVRLLSGISPHMERIGKELGLDGKLTLNYLPSFRLESNASKESITEALYESFMGAKKRDMEARHTTVGPHRDDIIFILGGQSLARYGSQGQKRAAILAFKLSVAQVLKNTRGTYPLVLLDDVASELDETRRKALGTLISEIDAQFVVTTTGDDYMFLSDRKGYVMTVEDGKIERIEKQGEQKLG